MKKYPAWMLLSSLSLLAPVLTGSAQTNQVYGMLTWIDGDSSVIKDAGPVSGKWSINGPPSSENAYADYGTNHIAYAWSGYSSFDPLAGYLYLTSSWADDSLAVTGGNGTAGAIFRIAVAGHHLIADGDGTAPSWECGVDSSQGTFGVNDQLRESTNYSAFLDFRYDFRTPFAMSGNASIHMGQGNYPASSAFADTYVTGVLLPDGASLSSGLTPDWTTNILVIHPSLSVSQAAADVILAWFAFRSTDCILETTTDLTDPASWIPVSQFGLLPAQAADTKFILSFPIMNEPSRFFRLRYNF